MAQWIISGHDSDLTYLHVQPEQFLKIYVVAVMKIWFMLKEDF